MTTGALSRPGTMPSLFEDFFMPLSQWFDDSGLVRRIYNLPSVNITENPAYYTVSLAAPGLSKDNFKIEMDGHMLTISSETEEKKEERDEKYTRKEYSYSTFSRSFALPEDVKEDAIEARYENGELRIKLPRKGNAKKAVVFKRISVK